MANLSKFNFQEIFSNDNGKSSGSGFAGVIICLVCSLCFMAGVVDKMFFSHTSDIMNASIGFSTLGAGLLGVRKVMQNKTAVLPIDISSAEEPIVTPEDVNVEGKPDA
jgi:C4-dicarboxylate transporter